MLYRRYGRLEKSFFDWIRARTLHYCKVSAAKKSLLLVNEFGDWGLPVMDGLHRLGTREGLKETGEGEGVSDPSCAHGPLSFWSYEEYYRDCFCGLQQWTSDWSSFIAGTQVYMGVSDKVCIYICFVYE